MTLIQFLIWYGIAIQPGVNLSDNIKNIVKDLREVYAGKVLITSNVRFWGVKNTLHKCGKAIDMRLWGLSKHNINDILKLQGDKYDVVIEQNHIHIEYKLGGSC